MNMMQTIAALAAMTEDERRGMAALDWLIRSALPEMLHASGRNAHIANLADSLQRLSPVRDEDSAAAAQAILGEIQHAVAGAALLFDRQANARQEILPRLAERVASTVRFHAGKRGESDWADQILPLFDAARAEPRMLLRARLADNATERAESVLSRRLNEFGIDAALEAAREHAAPLAALALGDLAEPGRLGDLLKAALRPLVLAKATDATDVRAEGCMSLLLDEVGNEVGRVAGKDPAFACRMLALTEESMLRFLTDEAARAAEENADEAMTGLARKLDGGREHHQRELDSACEWAAAHANTTMDADVMFAQIGVEVHGGTMRLHRFGREVTDAWPAEAGLLKRMLAAMRSASQRGFVVTGLEPGDERGSLGGAANTEWRAATITLSSDGGCWSDRAYEGTAQVHLEIDDWGVADIDALSGTLTVFPRRSWENESTTFVGRSVALLLVEAWKARQWQEAVAAAHRWEPDPEPEPEPLDPAREVALLTDAAAAIAERGAFLPRELPPGGELAVLRQAADTARELASFSPPETWVDETTLLERALLLAERLDREDPDVAATVAAIKAAIGAYA